MTEVFVIQFQKQGSGGNRNPPLYETLVPLFMGLFVPSCTSYWFPLGSHDSCNLPVTFFVIWLNLYTYRTIFVKSTLLKPHT